MRHAVKYSKKYVLFFLIYVMIPVSLDEKMKI